MTVDDIKDCVDLGMIVHWYNDLYTVIKDQHGEYLIECVKNGSCIGLTHLDLRTLNGEEKEFYVHNKQPSHIGGGFKPNDAKQWCST